jgi:hypothetical protein
LASMLADIELSHPALKAPLSMLLLAYHDVHLVIVVVLFGIPITHALVVFLVRCWRSATPQGWEWVEAYEIWKPCVAFEELWLAQELFDFA